MYPRMITDAKGEGNDKALKTFSYANEVEKIHAALYKKALAELSKTKAVPDYYVCKVCGYTAEGAVPDNCPVCKANRAAFMMAE
jgi:rubrerythrin